MTNDSKQKRAFYLEAVKRITDEIDHPTAEEYIIPVETDHGQYEIVVRKAQTHDFGR